MSLRRASRRGPRGRPKLCVTSPDNTARCAQLRSRLAGHELEERAVATIRLVLLVQERKIVLVELAEPLVPVEVLELVLPGATRKVDAEYPGIFPPAGALNRRRHASVLFHPRANLIMIGCRLAAGRHDASWPSMHD